MIDDVSPASGSSSDRRICAIQIALLAACSLLFVRDDVAAMLREGVRNPESAHLLAAPLLIALLWWSRRRDIVTLSPRGSMVGIVLLAAGVAIFVLCTYPFSYLQPRRLALPVLLAGAVLTTAGWRGLRFWAPMLLLIGLAIPMGARFFVALIVRPETITLEMVQAALDLVPDWTVTLQGLDLTYFKDSGATGPIALGQPNRGAQHMMATASVIVFAHFFRVRGLAHLITIGVLGLPILFLANGCRLFVAAVWTITREVDPLDSTPLVIGAVVGLFGAYLMTLAVAGATSILLAKPPPSKEPTTS